MEVCPSYMSSDIKQQVIYLSFFKTVRPLSAADPQTPKTYVLRQEKLLSLREEACLGLREGKMGYDRHSPTCQVTLSSKQGPSCGLDCPG